MYSARDDRPDLKTSMMRNLSEAEQIMANIQNTLLCLFLSKLWLLILLAFAVADTVMKAGRYKVSYEKASKTWLAEVSCLFTRNRRSYLVSTHSVPTPLI